MIAFDLTSRTAALLVLARFGLGGLRECPPARKRVELLDAHPGQAWVGEHRKCLRSGLVPVTTGSDGQARCIGGATV